MWVMHSFLPVCPLVLGITVLLVDSQKFTTRLASMARRLVNEAHTSLFTFHRITDWKVSPEKVVHDRLVEEALSQHSSNVIVIKPVNKLESFSAT